MAVFERYYHELLNFIAGRTGCRERAQDVVQESYARVLASHGSTLPAQPRALLYATARNLLVDQYRQQARQPEQTELDEDSHAAAPGCEPERTVAAQQQLDCLLHAVSQLPPRCRQAFVLYKFDGLSSADIAEKMGISVNMVEKHIINGMLACKQAMTDQDAR